MHLETNSQALDIFGSTIMKISHIDAVTVIIARALRIQGKNLLQRNAIISLHQVFF
jgi:hypothetical protein